jgi:NAD+ kinase
MQTVALIPRRSKPEALVFAATVADWLLARGKTVVCEATTPVTGADGLSSEELAERADLVVVLGGDGTLLHTARLFQRREVPILGINLGSLGFMTDVPRERTFEALEHTLAGRYTLERRTKLTVEVVRGGQAIFEGEVLNDAVIGKNALARIADIEATVEGAWLTTFKADGVIISTPTGSSAYALAAGGPLMHPGVGAVLLTPICPHTLTQRPIVLPEGLTLEFALLSESEMFVTLDGQTGRALERGDRVIVRRAPTSTVLVRSDHASYFAVLRNKLRWGER